ncbi:MAG: family 16 glycosylhydrolase [Chloroflexota bacterium]|nr:family 16 glycosylhydrolase [Chloroflexota bacterium]
MDVKAIYEDFSAELDSHWRRYTKGSGALEPTGSTLRFVTTDTTSRRYSDAQIDDYQGLPRRRFPWRPPLRLTVRARFSHPAGQLQGTAGFGFWNDPFMMTGTRLPTLPRALWFFYGSPPSNMKLDLHTPGHGWKAATIDALRPAALLLAPLAPLAVLLMNLRPLYRALWPPIQRALNVREATVEAETREPNRTMTGWHTYTIEWGTERVRFSVDKEPVLEDAPSPRGPLGFVMWLDNQYMVVTPWGRLRWGLLDIPGRQWMEVDSLTVGPLQDSGEVVRNQVFRKKPGFLAR